MTDKPLSNPGGFSRNALDDAYAMANLENFDGVLDYELYDNYAERQGAENAEEISDEEYEKVCQQEMKRSPRVIRKPRTETKQISHQKKRMLLRVIERAGRRLTDEQIDRAVYLLGK